MEHCFFPKDILDLIFNLSDLHTKSSIKELCKFTNNSYIMISSNPFKKQYVKCTVIYNMQKEYTNINTMIKKDISSERDIIINAYNFLIKKYDLNVKEPIEFKIKWNDKSIKYTIIDNKIISTNRYENIYILDNEKRQFTVIFNNKRYGTYTSKTPMQAAKKAFNGLLKNKIINPNNLDCTYNFAIQEVTPYSSYKYFGYNGMPKLLNFPQVVNLRGGGQIIYTRCNKIKPMKFSKTLLDYTILIKNN